jgi:beta-ureidopropionase
MIEPYTAVGLIPSFWGIRGREDIKKTWSISKAGPWPHFGCPVWTSPSPRARYRGSTDEFLDVDHAEFARTCAIDIPCPEPDRLGRLAHSWGVFIMAQVKARHEDWPDRFFNVGSIIDPDGGLS